MQTVLILGSKGMLGQELIREFAGHGYRAVGYDKDELDITSTPALVEKLDELKPSLIINAAALNAVDKIEEFPETYELARLLNADVVGTLARLCQERNSTLVHYSSDYVFAGTQLQGYREDDETSPISKYGETKALGERFLQEEGNKFYVIRLSKLFGQPASSEGAKSSFVDSMLSLATTMGKVHIDAVDAELSSPTYAPDAARLTRELYEEAKPYGVYHGANSGACTWYEFAQKIFALKGLSLTVHPVSADTFPRPAKRPAYSILLSTKLPPQRSWEEALAEYLQ